MSAASRNLAFVGSSGYCGQLSLFALLLFVFVGSAFAQGDESLADYARRVRTPKKQEVLVSADEGALLFRSVDEISKFASEDCGLPRLGPIKRQLIGHAETEKRFVLQTEDEAQHERRMDEATLVLKKFGMLPPQFELGTALSDYSLNSLAGFYDFNDKTMYLLNWIEPEMQKMVMAHELTHALQDQSYHLADFVAVPREAPDTHQMNMMREDTSELSIARRAVIEGQATVVGLDYVLREAGISLAESPKARQLAYSLLLSSYSPAVTIHNAPRLLREVMIFPYREGLLFELELLTQGGREQAFQAAFKRPPVNTHQVLQPDAYLRDEKPPQIPIGDLTAVFGGSYEPYDSGSIGEFDVQIMAQDFGRENDIYTVARQWNGGSYVAVKRSAIAPGTPLGTGDLALVYLSRWKTSKAGERFGKIYLQALGKRLPVTDTTERLCEEHPCPGPLWELHANSSEGPVNIELWPANRLIITHGVDAARMTSLRPLLLSPTAAAPLASLEAPELSLRLLDHPQMQALSEQAGQEIYEQLLQLLTQ